MPITTQDFESGADLTGITNIGATELMQMIQAGKPASETGMVLETTDTAANVPLVPDPNVEINGVLPDKWKRYFWRRIPFGGAEGVQYYYWDDAAVSAATLLKWQLLLGDVLDAVAIAEDAALDASTALNASTQALQAANSATTVAGTANNTANTALTTANSALATATAATVSISANTPAGTIIMFAGSTSFSTVNDEGWLECDGTAVSRTTFSGLFASISTTFGIGDGATTFNIPDFRGRSPIGAGTGAGLTARVKGTNYGAEGHSAVEANIPLHDHDLTSGQAAPVGGVLIRDNTISPNLDAAAGAAVKAVQITAFGADPVTAIPTVTPSLGIRFLIKT